MVITLFFRLAESAPAPEPKPQSQAGGSGGPDEPEPIPEPIPEQDPNVLNTLDAVNVEDIDVIIEILSEITKILRNADLLVVRDSLILLRI